MTDEKLADLKARYAALSAIVAARGKSFRAADGTLDMMTPDEGAAFFAQMIAVCAEDMPALLAEVERLTAREAALMALVERVAEAGVAGSALICGCNMHGWLPSASPVVWPINQPVYHASDCIFVKARALLGDAADDDGDTEVTP